MSAQVLQTTDLGRHAARWDALVTASPLPSPFLRSWWLGSLDPKREPRFVLVLDGERLLGGLALQCRRVLGVEVLTVLGGGRLCPDHLDLVADPAREDDVVAALRSWFQGSARVLDLDGLREDALALDAFEGAVVTTTDITRCEPLSSDPAEYHAARSTSFTRKGRKARRRLECAGVEFRRTPPGEVESAFDAFEELHAVRDDRLPLLRHRDEIRRFVLAGVTAGEVRVHEAIRDDQRVAILIGFVTGDRWMTYQLARSLDHEMRDVGTVLRLSAVDDACLTGLTELDLLRGDEPYKRSFTTVSRRLLRVRAAHGLGGRALLTAARCVEAARHSLGIVRQQWLARTRRSRG
ncbi:MULTISPECIES: GNAT family N-acetyltransferase [Nocardioides]|uniref:GNAT family N-acetyltransferase n=1 Tax=Nocardioides vastitatis TaxID=2568655 RepID=A0ABW0ZC46_9ACTN|nr:GNAT family N-acetyltransferase [Nocardioides sp.]